MSIVTTLLGGLGLGVLGARQIMEETETPTPAAHAAFTDLSGQSVLLEGAAAPSEAAWEQMQVVDDDGLRFQASSVGLDVKLGSVNEVAGVVTPGGFDAAYLIRNRGVSPAAAEEGTVYVVMHSARGLADAPGNYLIDVADARSTLSPGERIIVGDRAYVVDGTRAVPKELLPHQHDLWADEPNRLVVITCLQNSQQTASTENMVVIAHLE